MKKIIIIGAGIAGLTAGVYAQKNGFESEIYEMHDIPGGECTGWQRGEYHFDGCIHWLVGSKPGTAIHEIWRDTGALDDSKAIHNFDVFSVYEADGRMLKVYRDADKLEKHLKAISPNDKKEIKRLCTAIRAVKGFGMPIAQPMDMMTGKDGLRFLMKNFGKILKTRPFDKVFIYEYVKRFKDPLLRQGLSSIIPDWYPASGLIYTLGGMNEGDCGYPLGGSLKFAARMEKKYISLGGKVRYKAKVDKILVEDGKAVGIRMADGSEAKSDYVISAADAHATFFDMMDDKYTPAFYHTLFSNNEKYKTQKCCLVSLGVDADFSEYPRQISTVLDVPIDGGGMNNEVMTVVHHCYDTVMAPRGKSVLQVVIQGDYDYWSALYQDRTAYLAEKKRLLKDVTQALTKRFPEIEGKIEVTDVATPATYTRYCNAWRGSWMTWPSGCLKELPQYFNGLLDGLDNFIIAGMWTLPPGGLPGASVSGRFAIHRLCIREGREFVTE